MIFKREECFQRKNRLYRHISLWLAEAVTGETQFPCNLNTGAAKDFLTKSCYSLIEDGDDSADECKYLKPGIDNGFVNRMS